MVTYDPAQIICSFLGNILIGFADGTFVKAERAEDQFMLKVGAGGESARARNRNRSGTIAFTLLATSPSNDILSAAATADELAGTGVGTVQVKDLNGLSLALAATAWVKKKPSVEFGKEVGTREWVLETNNLDIFVGGQLV
jgi:hypothetical protein